MSNYIDHRVRSTYCSLSLSVFLVLTLVLTSCNQKDTSYESPKERQVSEALHHLEQGRKSRAEKILVKLAQKYKKDRQVHIALATVYMAKAGISYRSFIGLVHSLDDFGNAEARRRQQQNRRLIFRRLSKNFGLKNKQDAESFVNWLDALDELSIFLDHFLALPDLSSKSYVYSELAIRSLMASEELKQGDYLLLGLLQATVFRFKLQHQRYIRHRDVRKKRTRLILNGYDRLLLDLKAMVRSFVLSSQKISQQSRNVLTLIDDHQQGYRSWRYQSKIDKEKLLVSEFVVDWWCFRKYQRTCIQRDHRDDEDELTERPEYLPERPPWVTGK